MKEEQLSGLCGSCLNAPDCVFLKNVLRPVFECGEFNPILKKDSNTTPKKIKPTAQNKSEAPASSEHQGLCRICDRRNSCEYTKNQTIIWHCEEYE